jgi:tRNA-intron endonuclease
MNKLEQNEKKGIEEARIKVVLAEGRAVIKDPEECEGLSSRGYGTIEDGKLVLNIYETLFLLSKGLLEFYKPDIKTDLEFKDLLHQHEKMPQNIWYKYLIYRDLRSRGYVVREGFGLEITFRVYRRGDYGKATATYLILGMQEGKPVTIKELTQVLKHTQSLKKKLVLAVVNRRGEIVYYTISKQTMK